MTQPKIVCVVPTVRPECHARFVAAWRPLFEKHQVTLVTVWDGECPEIEISQDGKRISTTDWTFHEDMDRNRDLFCRHTDACRNLGFVAAAPLLTSPEDVVLTLDDDCHPEQFKTTDDYWKNLPDPIQDHIDALSGRVPLGWMNTAHNTDLYLRGVPYGVRTEAPVMLSHGVWVGTPDFDGETQLRLEQNDDVISVKGGPSTKISGVPHSLPYYVGPIPRGVLFPLCGMNVMVKRDALPYLYYAPMGKDSGVKCPVCKGEGGASWFEGREKPYLKCEKCNGTGSQLHRFADIFMGVFLKREFDRLGWGCVTGYSTVHHTRASDARKNFEQEKLGREWMENTWWSWIDEEIWKQTTKNPPDADPVQWNYFRSYADKRARYAELITTLLKDR